MVSAAPAATLFANDPASLGRAEGTHLPANLEREIRAIYRRSPLYGRRFPLHAEPLGWPCYREIPALTKQEIVQQGHAAFFADYAEIERGFLQKKYEYEHTSGTTSGPMTVIMEDGWWNAQLLRAYLAHPLLAEYARRPYRKCVLAPVGCSSNLCPYEDHPFPHRYFDGTVYLNLSSDPFAFPEAEWDRIVLELQAVKPEVIEGNAFVELAPWRAGEEAVFQILVTTRDREAMPLLRYRTGDLVRRLPGGYRILGREKDLHFRPDGAVISAHEIDQALPEDFACWHWSLVQVSEQRWEFQYVAEAAAPAGLEPALAGALGGGARVTLFRRKFIQPAASGKFALLKPQAS